MASTNQYPVILDRYYIVNLSNLLIPKLFPVVFISRAAAKRALQENIPKRSIKHYSVVRGNKLNEFRYRYLFSMGVMSKFTKYTYPPKCDNHQTRKTYRTVMRRRLRRMGMLTLVKPKHHIKSKPQIVKLVKNKQKVAMSPGTNAKAFKLERKPGKYIYLILSKEISGKRGMLFTIKCLRLDTVLGKCKKTTQNIKRKDIIKPMLLTEVYGSISSELRKKLDKRSFNLSKGK